MLYRHIGKEIRDMYDHLSMKLVAGVSVLYKSREQISSIVGIIRKKIVKMVLAVREKDYEKVFCMNKLGGQTFKEITEKLYVT